jgi:hypothetical protein
MCDAFASIVYSGGGPAVWCIPVQLIALAHRNPSRVRTDLAEKAGVAIGTVKLFELSKAPPIPITLAALQRALEEGRGNLHRRKWWRSWRPSPQGGLK